MPAKGAKRLGMAVQSRRQSQEWGKVWVSDGASLTETTTGLVNSRGH